MSKKVFKNNSLYVDYEVKASQRIGEVFKTFVKALKTRILDIRSKNYFLGTNISSWVDDCKPLSKSFDPVITWIGQASFLIQIGGVNILTDPIFSDLLFLYRRTTSPGISLKNLPKIDYIIISHNHSDHMEKKSLLSLKAHNPTVLAPLGDRNWFVKNGFENVYEKDWWESESFSLPNLNLDNLKITFLPSIHWSGNSLFNINKSLWGSWMIEFMGQKIYFGGDSAYSKHFAQIGEKFKQIDVALLPIAPNQPRELVKYSHIDTQEAVQAFVDLKAKTFVPMHWGTFRFGIDKFDEPIKILKNHWKNESFNLNPEQLKVLKFGQQFKLNSIVQAKQHYCYESL